MEFFRYLFSTRLRQGTSKKLEIDIRTSIKRTRVILRDKATTTRSGETYRSQNTDEGFYCIGQDIKVRVTSVRVRETVRGRSPSQLSPSHRFALSLLLSHESRPIASESAACARFAFFLGPREARPRHHEAADLNDRTDGPSVGMLLSPNYARQWPHAP